MQVAAIIAAVGRGVRFGADRPKQFLDIGDGKTMIELSSGLAASDRISNRCRAAPGSRRRGAKALRQAIGRPYGRRRRPPPGFGGERVRGIATPTLDSRRRSSVCDAR
jgi:hypothetical protein